MNDLEYLRQISQTNRPVKQSGGLGDILRSKLFKFAMVGLVLLILIVIFGSMLGQFSGKEKDTLVRINLRMTNMSAMVTKYNSSVKSSRLRAMGVTLSGILSETSRDLFSVLVADYGYSEGGAGQAVTEEETQRAATATAVLDRAVLNGVLDRTYLHQLVYDVASLISLQSEALSRTDNAQVKQILQNSSNSLNVLYEQLVGYSDSTN